MKKYVDSEDDQVTAGMFIDPSKLNRRNSARRGNLDPEELKDCNKR